MNLGGVHREGWNCKGGVGGIWKRVWIGGNCKYELFIYIYNHHLLWL